MQPFLLQRYAELAGQQPAGEEPVHFTESLVTSVLEELTGPGDLVLDPFAGFGTTLVVGERMGRRVLGVELLPDRVAATRERLADPDALLEGDARSLPALLGDRPEVAGQVALVLTSPPYRAREEDPEHPEDPLDGYRGVGPSYGDYLADLRDTLVTAAGLLRPGGHLVVNVANLRTAPGVTTLAWDLAAALRSELALVQEVFLVWDRQPEEVTGDYLLVLTPAPTGTSVPPRAVHHLDLWVRDAGTAAREWGWLLTQCGWSVDIEDSSWRHPDGTYVYLERSPAQLDVDHDRLRPGVNHVAVEVPDRRVLDRIRAAAGAHGWQELFAGSYPHAGGEQHTALYVESSEGFEVEVVVAG